jgi:hypothetical protein
VLALAAKRAVERALGVVAASLAHNRISNRVPGYRCNSRTASFNIGPPVSRKGSSVQDS